jgi:hypothetical protein
MNPMRWFNRQSRPGPSVEPEVQKEPALAAFAKAQSEAIEPMHSPPWDDPPETNSVSRLRMIVREEIKDAERRKRQRKQFESDDFWDMGCLG